ncbi:MAG: isochorismatase family protein [Pigmentiphaga sp.]|uniref:isochorismatase family protein n=1 Tax=Pigmentiphaga sp. TaxID=1977564 RepID=UPI0029BCCA0E|nr:isochorismatase family protein [Pigmentiphaga sp.]MDX3907794.1 isochorismatase family protein [Pigmentiphaga sp.]
MSTIWHHIIPEEDRAASRAAGFGRPSGLGHRPALLIIDVQYRTAGTRPMPFDLAIKEFATSCGEIAWQAIGHIAELLALFRERNWPVLYPYVAPKFGFDQGRLTEKVPTMMEIPAKGYEFVEAIAPRAGDVLLPKKHPSAFFGTPLASYLVNTGADTLVVTGCATSGCIRSSVVDAFSYNYRVAVPEDAVYDRNQTSHAVNLYDMAEKYADVMDTKALLKALSELGHANAQEISK